MFGGAIGWAKGKYEKGKAFVKDKYEKGKSYVKGKAQGLKDKLTGKDHEPAEGKDGEAVKRKVRAALAANASPVETEEELDARLQGIMDTYRPEGLKSLRTVVPAGDAEHVEVLAEASPLKGVGKLATKVKTPEDLPFSSSRSTISHRRRMSSTSILEAAARQRAKPAGTRSGSFTTASAHG